MEQAPPVRVVLDGTVLDAVVEDRALELRAPAGPATATLTTSAAVLRGLAFGDLDLDAELAAGGATVDGSRTAVRASLAAFARPARSSTGCGRTAV